MAIPGRTIEKWRAYWSDKTLPEHDPDTPEFYRFHARELRLLFDEKPPRRVLEIGCGNGALYPLLGFDHTKYRGVDFSPSMLAIFKSRHPEVNLGCEEVSSYIDTKNKYDLIFSNAVVQNLDRVMLDSHFACARAMVHKESLFVCGSIPWKALRWRYFGGSIPGSMPVKLLSLPFRLLRIALFGDPVGYWYHPREIAQLAERHGFSAKFYGSIAYMHRFHAVMRLK